MKRGHLGIWVRQQRDLSVRGAGGTGVPGSRGSQCKGPEVTCLVCWRGVPQEAGMGGVE